MKLWWLMFFIIWAILNANDIIGENSDLDVLEWALSFFRCKYQFNPNPSLDIKKLTKFQQSKSVLLEYLNHFVLLKFTYSEKATKFCEISTLDLSYVVQIKSMYGGDCENLWPSQNIRTLNCLSWNLDLP